MLKRQILLCAFLVTCVAILFGKNDEEDEFREEELSFLEEEESRKKATIDSEIMTKMADVNNHDIPVLSLDDQVAIVDKGVDFSRPFNAALVKSELADVMREQLPPDAPEMTTEELLRMKDTLEKTADPETSKAIAKEKKEASSKNKSGTSPSGPGSLERGKIVVEEAAHNVVEEAEHLIENLKEGKAGKYSDDWPLYRGEAHVQQPTNYPQKAILFGTKDDEEEFLERELSFQEEEESRKKATINGEIMTKMADVNNHDIPVLSLDDQVAIVDKGVDFSRPFNAALVKITLAEVMREKLPPYAPEMTTEELLRMKDTMDETADPQTSKAVAKEKKEASKNKHGTSPSGLSFIKRGKVVLEEAAHKVDEEAGHLVENLKKGNEGEFPDGKPEDVAEPDAQQRINHLQVTNQADEEPIPQPSSGSGFFERANVAEEAAHAVSERAENLVENEEGRNGGESGGIKPEDEGKPDAEQSINYLKVAKQDDAELSPQSPSGSGFLERANVVEEAAHEVGERADHLVENLEGGNAGESDDSKPADGVETHAEQPMNYLKVAEQTDAEPSPSPRGPGFPESAKIGVEEAGHKVGEEAEHVVENSRGENADGSEPNVQHPMNNLKIAKQADAQPSPPSSTEPGSLKRGKIDVKEAAHKVVEDAEHLVENLKGGNDGRSVNNKPADAGEPDVDQPINFVEVAKQNDGVPSSPPPSGPGFLETAKTFVDESGYKGEEVEPHAANVGGNSGGNAGEFDDDKPALIQ